MYRGTPSSVFSAHSLGAPPIPHGSAKIHVAPEYADHAGALTKPESSTGHAGNWPAQVHNKMNESSLIGYLKWRGASKDTLDAIARYEIDGRSWMCLISRPDRRDWLYDELAITETILQSKLIADAEQSKEADSREALRIDSATARTRVANELEIRRIEKKRDGLEELISPYPRLPEPRSSSEEIDTTQFYDCPFT